MIIGDNIFVGVNNKVFRPSDIGQPVEMSNVWTLKFNYGISLDIWGSPEFLIHSYECDDRVTWLSLDNLTSGTNFGTRTPLSFPEAKWNSKIKLDDYIPSKAGETFDISSDDFAWFTGWFCFAVKPHPENPGIYRALKKQVGDLKYAKKLFPKGSIYEEGIYFYFKKCWVTELMDVILDFTNEASLPDEIIYSASERWLDMFMQGLFSMAVFDVSTKRYRTYSFSSSFINDLSVITQRLGIPFEVSFSSCGDRFNFRKGQTRGKIISGFENKHPLLMYDIGKGEFNISGIIMRDL